MLNTLRYEAYMCIFHTIPFISMAKALPTQPKVNEQYEIVHRPTCSAGLRMGGRRGRWKLVNVWYIITYSKWRAQDRV